MALGKQYKGQSSFVVKTVDDVKAEMEIQKPYDKEGAVPLHVYFVHKEIKNVVMQASMKAFTKVQRATIVDWDSIFQNF